MTRIEEIREEWPETVSDGLVLPCSICREKPKFDFRVTDTFWKLVAGDEDWRLGVVCLPCFDQEAAAKGHDISEALLEVQFIGVGKTIVLHPEVSYRYDPP